MKKTYRVLSLVLALLLPLSALAETAAPTWADTAWENGKQIVTTLTATPGESLAKNAGVADLLKALALQVTGQKGGYGGFSLLLDGKEALTTTFRADESGLFAQIPQLAAYPFFFAWEDLEKGMQSMTEMAGASANPMAATQFSSLKDAILGKEIPHMEAGSLQAPADEKAVHDALMQQFSGDEAMVKIVEDIMKRAVVTQGEFTDPSHDPATTQTVMEYTKEDMLAMFDTQYMKDMMKGQLAPSFPTLSPEELDAKIQETMAEGKAEIAKMEWKMPITVLTNAQEEPVSMTIPMAVTVPENGSQPAQNIAMDLLYNRLTTGDTKNHAFSMDMQGAPEANFTLSGLVTEMSETNWEFNVDVDDHKSTKMNLKGYAAKEGEETTFVVGAVANGVDVFQVNVVAKAAADANDVSIELLLPQAVLAQMEAASQPSSAATGPETASAIEAAPAPAPAEGLGQFLTLNIHSQATEPDGRFASLEAATPETSKQPLKMSGTELEALGQELSTSAMQLLMSVMSMMPASVVGLLMEAGM